MVSTVNQRFEIAKYDEPLNQATITATNNVTVGPKEGIKSSVPAKRPKKAAIGRPITAAPVPDKTPTISIRVNWPRR